jgi:aspartate aminotransferase
MQHLVQCLQDVTIDVDEYQRKRNFLYEQLTGLGYEIVKPHGAFYLFPRSLIDDDVKFVEQLQEHNVLTVPGTGFGSPGHFRISYCVEDRVLEGALEGFAKVAENIRN